MSIDGVFTIDFKWLGPHALVAGPTGSDKSEFLQTLVVSLAVANRPDGIHFVLVDYKGASAIADCAALPHTVGMVTNLDGRETQRALTSLEAELRRRQVCLHELGAGLCHLVAGCGCRVRLSGLGSSTPTTGAPRRPRWPATASTVPDESALPPLSRPFVYRLGCWATSSAR